MLSFFSLAHDSVHYMMPLYVLLDFREPLDPKFNFCKFQFSGRTVLIRVKHFYYGNCNTEQCRTRYDRRHNKTYIRHTYTYVLLRLTIIKEFDKKGYTPEKNLTKRGTELFRRRRRPCSPSNRLQIKIYSVCRAPWAPPNHPEFFLSS